MKSPFEFSTAFGEVYLDTAIELPIGGKDAFRDCLYVESIDFQYYGRFSNQFCYLVKFSFHTSFDESALRDELQRIADEFAEQMNSVQDYEPAES